MNEPRRNPNRSRRSRGPKRGAAQDLWRPVPLPEPPEPIKPASDPRALLASLGPLPLRDQSAAAESYLGAVVERAAALAAALAASAGVLVEPDD